MEDLKSGIKKQLAEGGMRAVEISSRIDEDLERVECALKEMLAAKEIEINTDGEDDPDQTYYVLWGWLA